MIKLVLSDLDSTLIWREDHVITSFALEAVRTVQAAGVHFAPCTGRIYRDLPRMFAGDAAACSTAVTSNGQLVYLDGELIEKVPVSREALLRVAELLRPVDDAYLVVEFGGQKVAVEADLGFVLANPDSFWRVETSIPDVPLEPCYKANVRVVGSYERCRDVAAELARSCPALDFVCPIIGVPHIDITPHGFGKDHGATSSWSAWASRRTRSAASATPRTTWRCSATTPTRWPSPTRSPRSGSARNFTLARQARSPSPTRSWTSRRPRAPAACRRLCVTIRTG